MEIDDRQTHHTHIAFHTRHETPTRPATIGEELARLARRRRG